MKTFKSQAGLTLIELLVASIVALIATGAALELYISQQKHWMAQENITDMQQNGRAAVDEIVFQLRQAGYHLPQGLDAIEASNSDPDTIIVTYCREPICNPKLSHVMANPSAEMRCDSADLSCLQEDSWAYIYNPTTFVGEYFWITDVQQATHRIQHSGALTAAYPANSLIYVVDRVAFYIDNQTDPEQPKLMIARLGSAPAIYADNIEDLQFTYTTTYGTTLDTVVLASLVREVNVQLVAASSRHSLLNPDEVLKDTFATNVFVRNLAF